MTATNRNSLTLKRAFSTLLCIATAILAANSDAIRADNATPGTVPLTGAANHTIWPGTPPGETLPQRPEQHGVNARYKVFFVENVWQPTLEYFPAPADNNTGAAVLICPGGGYGRLAYEHEGTEIARWLNTQGITGFILKYRVPHRPKTAQGALPLMDAQRALSFLRANATTLKIAPDRIGIMGFSAGGHLAALASTAQHRTYKPVDDIDAHPCRPNFTILVYPAYCVEKGALSPRLPVDKTTPPAICIHATDDNIIVDSSLRYYAALRKAGVPAEMHIYSKGGHGYGMRPDAHPSTTWPACVAAWIKAGGWLNPKKTQPRK